MIAKNNNCLRCGTCVHFVDGPAHPQYGRLCQDMGIREYRPAPDCYTPAPIKIVRADVDISAVGRMLRHLSADQMIVLGQLLTQASELEEYNLKFGQPVYVNLGSGEYLTNYFKGFIVGATTVQDDDKTQHLYVSSDLSFEQEDAPEFRTLLRLTPDSLFTTAEFKGMKERMVAKGKLEAPEKDGHKIPLAQWIRMEEKPALPPSDADAYEPPTIDTAPAAWLDPFSEEDTEQFKVEKKARKKTKGLEAKMDPAAEAKRAERARRKLNVVESLDDDGNKVRTVSYTSDQSEADMIEQELIEAELLDIDMPDGGDSLDLELAAMMTGLPSAIRY